MAERAVIQPTPWGESEIRGPVHLFRERLMMRQFRRLLPSGRVLDAGCGSGSMAFDLCRDGYRVEAIEQSLEFAALVRHKMYRLGEENRLTIQRCSVAQLPFADESFDGVVCGEVLEHVTADSGGDGTVVREFHRVCRTQAACLVSVPMNPGLWDHSDEWAGHVKRYELEELVSLFEDSGFEVLGTRVWGFPFGRIYHRFLFAPWIRKTSALAPAEREARRDTRSASNRTLVELAAGALRFDELFASRPWGRGLVLAAKKRG